MSWWQLSISVSQPSGWHSWEDLVHLYQTADNYGSLETNKLIFWRISCHKNSPIFYQIFQITFFLYGFSLPTAYILEFTLLWGFKFKLIQTIFISIFSIDCFIELKFCEVEIKKYLNELNDLKFCKVSRNSFSKRCWKLHLFI